MVTKPTTKTALYRYEVTAVSGPIASQVKVGEVLQDTYLGEEYTWVIANLQTGETVGMITGKCLGPAAHQEHEA